MFTTHQAMGLPSQEIKSLDGKNKEWYCFYLPLLVKLQVYSFMYMDRYVSILSNTLQVMLRKSDISVEKTSSTLEVSLYRRASVLSRYVVNWLMLGKQDTEINCLLAAFWKCQDTHWFGIWRWHLKIFLLISTSIGLSSPHPSITWPVNMLLH